ncbi:MAG TPA: hypothetical protein VK254_00760 [Candidatus Bathyarchaeia archaeon]|nr:hypothetical protein [Candidatus Bathyarchaeia archaeon]
MKHWISKETPGYLGKRRDKKYTEWNALYGEGNWRLVHVFGGAVLNFLGVCAVYEDAYFEFLKGNPYVMCQLVEARDVWDDAESNVLSGFDYMKQETGRTHIQDIAIRRSVARMGCRFQGKELIRIRDKEGPHPLSLILSPGRVPFHRAGLIVKPELEGWWLPRSVESFYQSNRVLQVRE